MDCKEFRELIQDYLDGEIKDSKKQEFEGHLLTCEKCREEFEKAQMVKTALQDRLKELPSAAFLESQILERIRRKRYTRYSAIAVAAAVIISIAIGFISTDMRKITRKIETPVNVKYVKGTENLENKGVKSVKRIVQKVEKQQKKEISPLPEKKAKVTLVFPQDGDIIDEIGQVVLYVKPGVEKFTLFIDGEEKDLEMKRENDLVFIPLNILEDGPHSLTIESSETEEVIFYKEGKG